VALRCFNTSCPEKISASLDHFVSRAAMNIDGLGPALIQQLLDAGLVSTPADLFFLDATQLASLERMGEKSAANVIAALEAARKNSLDRLLHGLGIRMIGAQAAKQLARQVDDVREFYDMPSERLESIDGIGPVMAQSLRLYFDNGQNRDCVERMRAAGVNCAGIRGTVRPEGPLAGKTFVLTGTLERYTRDEARRLIEERGGKVVSTVSAKTDFVVAGSEPGSKLEKARTIGVTTIGEKEFIEMLGQ
jgi:DNA ligase (NAD+)